MSYSSKSMWLFVLIVVFALILSIGRSKVSHSRKVQASIESIYEDRLLVKSLIFDLASSLHEKEIAHITSDAGFFGSENEDVDASIDGDIKRFEQTTLTKAEEMTLDRFKADMHALQELESGLDFSADESVKAPVEARLTSLVADLKSGLKKLSDIQLDEGRRQMSLGDKAMESMDEMSTLENYMLIFLALIGVVVILYPRPSPD